MSALPGSGWHQGEERPLPCGRKLHQVVRAGDGGADPSESE
jgi:hypothetical protein